MDGVPGLTPVCVVLCRAISAACATSRIRHHKAQSRQMLLDGDLSAASATFGSRVQGLLGWWL